MLFELLSSLLYQSALHRQSAIPNGSIQVAYRQEDGGKPDERVSLAKLSCFDGRCELTFVDVGWCMPTAGPKGEKGAMLFMDRKTTEDGDLKVRSVLENNTGTIVAEEETHGAKITYRFEFALGNKSGELWFERLTGFSGAGVKALPIGQGKVESWALVPLKGEFSAVALPCKLLLPGVPSK